MISFIVHFSIVISIKVCGEVLFLNCVICNIILSCYNWHFISILISNWHFIILFVRSFNIISDLYQFRRFWFPRNFCIFFCFLFLRKIKGLLFSKSFYGFWKRNLIIWVSSFSKSNWISWFNYCILRHHHLGNLLLDLKFLLLSLFLLFHNFHLCLSFGFIFLALWMTSSNLIFHIHCHCFQMWILFIFSCLFLFFLRQF